MIQNLDQMEYSENRQYLKINSKLTCLNILKLVVGLATISWENYEEKDWNE